MKNIKHEDYSKNLRSFHNDIKNDLLTQAVKLQNLPINLLDIGVGRGGDMHKWNKLGIKNVIGIDVDKGYIAEAKERYREIKTDDIEYLFFNSNVNDPLNRSIYTIGKHTIQFNIISCQFAIHYYFSNLYKIVNLITDVSSKLTKGGVFIGTVPEGNEICKLLGTNNYFQNSSMHIHKCFDKSKGLGDLIKFTMAGTLYFGENLVSYEYLVFKDILVQHCEKKGLKLIYWKSFRDYVSRFKDNLDDDHKACSFINCAFIFQKV